MRRQLAAILFADVAGYTRLMDFYEAETHRRLMSLVNDVVRPRIQEATGEIVKNTGDGFLARFGSVNDALSAAVGIQQEVAQREATQPFEKRIAFRMGLHSGDITVEQHDVYGAGVNLAARLQELAEPGSIVISGSVREQLGGNLKLPVSDLGPTRLKNIADPVRAFIIPASPDREGRPALAPSPALPASRPSIAVLPFIEYGGSAAQGTYFGDGFAEDVVSALASLPDLFVISRNSTLKYRDSAANARTVGSELGVRYVFSGSVRRNEDQLRISAELADTETQTVIESYQSTGSTPELFGLQDHLVERVVQTIIPNIRGAELRRISRKRPESFDAYDYLLRGLDLLYRLDRTEFDQALHMFQQAIRLDPNYAAPYAFTALWHSARTQQGWSNDQAADFAAVEQFAAAALQRDPLDIWALALCGQLRALLFRDFDTAFDLLDRALSTCPNSAFAYARSSPIYSYIGDGTEGRRRAMQALRLSPFDPQLFFIHAVLGFAAYTEGDYDAAITWGRRSHAENPKYTANLRTFAASLAAGGRLEEAGRIGQALMAVDPGFRVRGFCENYAYRMPEQRDRFAAHLLLAGLPE